MSHRVYFSEALNKDVPSDTIIKVLLRKIKMQEANIKDLEDELRYYEKPHRFLRVLEHITEEEKRALRSNPYFMKVNAQYAQMEKEIKSKNEEIDRLYRIINNWY